MGQCGSSFLQDEIGVSRLKVSPQAGEVYGRIQTLIRQRPYLERKVHPLHRYVQKCYGFLEQNLALEAQDQLDRIQILVQRDSKRLHEVFKKFDIDSSGMLEMPEFRHFITYVGFIEEAMDDVVKESDLDNDGSISPEEFEHFAGRMGGIHALLEKRRRLLDENRTGDSLETASRVLAYHLVDGKISQPALRATVLELSDDERTVKLEFSMDDGRRLVQEVDREMVVEDLDLVDALKSIGFEDDAYHFWAMLLPLEEQYAVKLLARCQQVALLHTRGKAKINHESAVVKLMNRCEDMGIENHEVCSALTWIRDLAPVIIMVNLDKSYMYFETDTHYRNQFETNTSSGLLSIGTRRKWEHDLFGGGYDDASPFGRPKYGVLDVMHDHRGVLCARQYGDSYLMLKNVRLRTTFSPEDSGGLQDEKIAVLDQYAHVLLEFSNQELREVCRVANAKEGEEDRIGDSLKLEQYHYKEAQIHGEVDLKKHVERLVVHPRHRVDGVGEVRLREICRTHGWEFMWMDDEKKRRIYEERVAKDGKALEKIWENPDKIECPLLTN